VSRFNAAGTGSAQRSQCSGCTSCHVALGVEISAATAALGDFAGTGRRSELMNTARGVRVTTTTPTTRAKSEPRSPRPEASLATVASSRSTSPICIREHETWRPILLSNTRAAPTSLLSLTFTARGRIRSQGVTGALVSEAFNDQTRVAYCPDWSVAARIAAAHAQSGDIIMTLSCGDALSELFPWSSRNLTRRRSAPICRDVRARRGRFATYPDCG